MSTPITDAQDAFLRDHRWALIATTGPSGTPQVTMVAYHWDGHDIVMSIHDTAAKWRNVLARPRVCVVVTDDQKCLSVYGRAEAIATDPEREALTRRVLASLLPDHAAMLASDLERGLDARHRVIVRVTPDRAVGRI